MKILKSLTELRAWRQHQTATIGFVPTMGNLHEGHLKLVDLAQQHAQVVVVSIFVNPMQFGANEDLEAYPRTLTDDCDALQRRGVEAVFAPTVADVYPRGVQQQTTVMVPEISNILCGASRPGHFEGVATIVCKLFNMVQPDIAVFGEKDFQQLQVIRLMTADLSIPVKVLGMPTERHADGLAMSSRNGYLTPDERHIAPRLYQTLTGLIKAIQAGESIVTAEQSAQQQIRAAGFVIDYLSVRRRSDLQPPTVTDDQLVVLVAARLGTTRLIDNVQFDL